MGVFVKDGQITFDPVLLRKEEFITQPTTFEFFNLEGDPQHIQLPTGSLAFTFCQTLVIYHTGKKSGMQIHYANGNMEEVSGSRLDFEISQHIFKRDGVIAKIEYFWSTKGLI